MLTYNPSSLERVKPYRGWVSTLTLTPNRGLLSCVTTLPLTTDTWLKRNSKHFITAYNFTNNAGVRIFN